MLEKQTNKQTLDSSLGECLDYLRPSSENKLHFPQDVCVSDFKIQPPLPNATSTWSKCLTETGRTTHADLTKTQVQ